MRQFLRGGSFLILLAVPILAQSPSPSENDCRTPESSKPALRAQDAGNVAEIRAVDVRFEGSTKLALSEQNRIAAKLMDVVEKGRDGWQEDMQDRVRHEWEVRGFLRVQLKTDCRELSSSPDARSVAMTFHIEAGEQYYLSEIHFKNEKQFSTWELRRLFSINDGEVFNVDKIAEGIQAIREAYGERGFINFVAVPETTPDENQRVLLNVDIDEGKQFRISAIKLIGENQETAAALLRQHKIQPGEIFNLRLVEEFSKALGIHAADDIEHAIDETNGTVRLLISLPDNSD